MVFVLKLASQTVTRCTSVEHSEVENFDSPTKLNDEFDNITSSPSYNSSHVLISWANQKKVSNRCQNLIKNFLKWQQYNA